MRLSRRSALIIGASVVGVFALVLIGAVAARKPLVATLIGWQLASKDVAGHFSVTRVGLHEAELRDVVISHLSIERLYLRYDPWELMRGVFRTAEVDGVVVTLDLTGEGPVLGDLQRLVPEPGGESAWQRLPELTLRRARINALLPRGPLPVNLEANVRQGEGDSAALGVAFNGLSERLKTTGEARIQFNGLVPASGTLTADFAHLREMLTFSLRAQTETLTAERPETRFTLSGEGALTTLATELPWPEAWRPDAGGFRLMAEGSASFPLKAEALEQVTAQAMADVSVSGMNIPQATAPEWMRRADGTLKTQLRFETRLLAGTLSLDVGNAGSRLKAELPDLRLAFAESYDVETVALTGFSALATGMRTSFGTIGEVEVKGDLSGPPATPTGPLALRFVSPALAMNDFAAQGVALNAQVNLVPVGDGFRLVLSAPARLSVRTLRAPTLQPLQRLDARLLAASFDIDSTEQGWAMAHELSVQLPMLPLRISRQDAGPLPIDLRTRPVTVRFVATPGAPARIEAETTIESLVVPEARMSLTGSRVTLAGDPAGVLESDVTGGSLVHQVESPLFVPLTPRLKGSRRGGNLVLSGDLRGAGGGITIDATGAHDLNAGRGRLHFLLREIRFGRGGTEGERISPFLGTIEALAGVAKGEAEVAWRADGFDTKGVLALQGLSFQRQGMEIEGLDLNLTLDHLVPAHSLPRQQLKIRRLGAGVDLANIDLRFLLDSPEGAMRLMTETLAMDTLGGKVTAEGGFIAPMTGDANLRLNVAGINLAPLIQQLGFTELEAEGEIGGVIPVRLADGAVVITGADLSAQGGGRVRFRSPDTRQALASGGETVKLMLDALEDFRYDTLRMTIDKPAQGDTKIVMQLYGRNPAVLDGQIFHLNINLTGNADPLLAALAEGQRLRNQVMQPLFRLQPSPQPAAVPVR
jgi:hypothetical protein